METFLEEVAKKIVASHTTLSEVSIVLPTKRSIGFLKEAIKKQVKRPVFSPDMLSIEEFIEKLSSLEKVSEVALTHSFYQVYKSNTDAEHTDDFDTFISWAFQLLKDFNELDAYLVDAKKLFEELAALESISQWGKGEATGKEPYFYGSLFKYYEVLYQHLISKGKGYSGMLYREAINNISFYMEANNAFHYFVGLNALNTAEEQIIQEFLYEKRGTVLWDLDSHFYEDRQHPAGHFIRKYTAKWKTHLEPIVFGENFESSKNIHLISASKNVTQAKYASQIAEKYAAKHMSVAMVLGQESLLIPTLSSVSSFTDAWNVTMGYPVSSTDVATFFNLFFELHQGKTAQGYNFFKIEALFQSCDFFKLAEKCKIPVRKCLRHCIKNNTMHIKKSFFGKDKQELLDLLLNPFESISEFLNRLIRLCNLSNAFYSNSKDHDSTLWANSFLAFKALFEELQALHTEYSMISKPEQLQLLLKELLAAQKIDFKSSPFAGIQIMGLLETRALDFENVVITNVNEGILPKGKSFGTFIPFEIRKSNRLPTFLDFDKLFAYHFFRILQRAKNIHLLYNTTDEGLFSGEKSRFVYLLEHFHPEAHKIFNKQLEPVYETGKQKPKTAEKTTAVYQRLKEIATEGFSPSSLTQYIRDPYLFYEQRILGIRERSALEKTLHVTDKGTIIHRVLETLYTPYVGMSMKVEFYDEMLSKLEQTLQETYQKIFGGETLYGSNYMTVMVGKEVLQNFLLKEQKTVQENDLKIMALEAPFSGEIFLEKEQITICLKGTTDRIDMLNETCRVIDYKTGSIEAKDLHIKDWKLLRTDAKKNPAFQVLLYAKAFYPDFKEATAFQAGIISFRNFNNAFMPITVSEDGNKRTPLLMNSENSDKFERELRMLLKEIFGSTPFESK